MTTKVEEQDLNLDPITGAPGAHPVGTGAGSASMAAAGAAIGTVVGGPVGFAVGGVVGAVAGGLAGHSVAEKINPTAEDAYWRGNYATRPYVVAERDYLYYEPAYRYGWESRSNYRDRKWDEVEADLNKGWYSARGKSKIEWDEAKPATYDAWSRYDGVML